MQRMMNENLLRYKHKLNYVIANQDMHLVINISIHRIKPDIFSFSLFFFSKNWKSQLNRRRSRKLVKANPKSTLWQYQAVS